MNTPSREQVAARLREHAGELHALGVERVYLFGSVARGEAGPGSDVDLLFDRRSPMGWEIVDIYERLADVVGGKVDVVDRRALHPRLKQRIEAEAVRVL